LEGHLGELDIYLAPHRDDESASLMDKVLLDSLGVENKYIPKDFLLSLL
jgi:hypothetical protein